MSGKKRGGSHLGPAAAFVLVTTLFAAATESVGDGGGGSVVNAWDDDVGVMMVGGRGSATWVGQNESENKNNIIRHNAYVNEQNDEVVNVGEEDGGGTRRRALLANIPACPTGSEYDAAAASCLVQCKGGQYRSALNVTSAPDPAPATTPDNNAIVGVCVSCPVGEFREVDDDVKDACRPCPVGTSNPRKGQIACVPCSIQGLYSYQDQVRAVACKTCPANTLRAGIHGQDAYTSTTSSSAAAYISSAGDSGVSVAECTCEKGFYNPTGNNVTGEACAACPKGADCAGDTSPALSKSVYFGLPPPHQDYFLRCHRMINNESPCLGANRCLEGFTGMSCSRCKKGYYRFQRTCTKCESKATEISLIWAYFCLLIGFYIVKKLSTIVLPSMYIILTYVQCLSIVGNRQGWGTKRTKALLKSTEIVNFSLDLFIPSCAEEMPYVIKAVFFTLTPVFYVLVDSLLVDPFFKYAYPHVRRVLARTLLWLIRLKYKLRNRPGDGGRLVAGAGGTMGDGAAKEPSNSVAPDSPSGLWRAGDVGVDEEHGTGGGERERDTGSRRSMMMSDKSVNDALRYELGNGIMDVLTLQTPVVADEFPEKDAKGWIKKVLAWSHTHIKPKSAAEEKAAAAAADIQLTFGQQMKKHFFEDMRLMYVATTGALLKSLRCTPVGNRELQKFWLSDSWFGVSVLSTDPEQRCWEGQHALLVPYFIIMLILYAIGGAHNPSVYLFGP